MMRYSEKNQGGFEGFIELLGDRIGEAGNSITCGLGRIKGTKVVLVADRGRIQMLNPAGTWRRIGRIVSLATHLDIPLVLWNICFTPNAENAYGPNSSANHTKYMVVQKILACSSPVIAVFEKDLYDGPGIFWTGLFDAMIMVQSSEWVSKDNPQDRRLPIVGVPSFDEESAGQIQTLIKEINGVPLSELKSERMDRLRRSLKSDDLLSKC